MVISCNMKVDFCTIKGSFGAFQIRTSNISFHTVFQKVLNVVQDISSSWLVEGTMSRGFFANGFFYRFFCFKFAKLFKFGVDPLLNNTAKSFSKITKISANSNSKIT